jgi:hypothetical protein
VTSSQDLAGVDIKRCDVTSLGSETVSFYVFVLGNYLTVFRNVPAGMLKVVRGRGWEMPDKKWAGGD